MIQSKELLEWNLITYILLVVDIELGKEKSAPNKNK